MRSDSVLHDIKHELEGMPAELADDLKRLADEASPALGSVIHDARSRGAAVGSTLIDHLPDKVVSRVPDPVSDRLPAASSNGSRMKRFLLLGGLLATAGGAVAFWRRQQHQTSPRPAWMRDEAVSPSNAARSNGVQREDLPPEAEAEDLPAEYRDL